MARDLTRAQFVKAMRAHGFISEGFMGYWRMPLGDDGENVSVSAANGGPRLREQLSYMLKELDRLRFERAAR